MELIITYKIKEIRELQGMSIRELEKQSGVSRSQISDIENNHKDATVTTLCMIAIALGVLPSELFEIKVINL
ncbi:MAG: helix-turn-helix transcriptional regulator [Clostridiales bacterium]|nr:helix-turn-helix transcriptional regulator [Clostridiales bacterium]